MTANFDSGFLEPRFSAERTDVSRIGWLQPLHEEGLPVPCHLHGGRFALVGVTGDFFQDAREVLS